MAKVGRKANDYITKAGERVPGLIHQLDGRWRILATGKRYSADTEAEAVARFYQLTGNSNPTVIIPVSTISKEALASEEPHRATDTLVASLDSDLDEQGNVRFFQRVKEDSLIEWARNFIINDQFNAARLMRLPGLARVDIYTPPAGDITLDSIRDLYVKKSDSNWRTKGQVKSAINRLTGATNVVMINELTTPILITFRDIVNDELAPAGAAQIFSKIKAALAFGVKYGLDAEQITGALGRMKVLYAPKDDTKTHNPTPISRNDFHKLLRAADAEWRAILLVSLNMALYIEDVCCLKWEHFNLATASYVGQRNKTKILRVGSLWPETVAALKALPRRGQSPYVLTSKTGTRFVATSKYDTYRSLADGAGVSATFSSIRDGSYSVACEKCEDKIARVFAAHKFPGLMDSYIARHPHFVKPAADAVHAAYAPLPK